MIVVKDIGRIRNKRWKASYTVEAAWIMVLVFQVIVAGIQFAYVFHDQTKAPMVLHRRLEQLRYEEALISETEKESQPEAFIEPWGKRAEFSIEQKYQKWTGRVNGPFWSREIEISEYQPEGFLRKSAALRSAINTELEK